MIMLGLEKFHAQEFINVSIVEKRTKAKPWDYSEVNRTELCPKKVGIKPMKITITSEKQPEPQSEREIVLTLTEKEAEILCSISGSVMGQGPVRKFTDKIFHHLRDNFVDYKKYQFTGQTHQ